MNGFVEAGYIAVAAGLGSYSVWLTARSKKLNVAVVLTEDDEGKQHGNSNNDS